LKNNYSYRMAAAVLGKDREANWLPTPKGPFVMAMRLYWPKEEAVQGKWTAPSLSRV
jgi:hypothetical protein